MELAVSFTIKLDGYLEQGTMLTAETARLKFNTPESWIWSLWMQPLKLDI